MPFTKFVNKNHGISRLMLQRTEDQGRGKKDFVDNVKMHPILVSVSKIDDRRVPELARAMSSERGVAQCVHQGL